MAATMALSGSAIISAGAGVSASVPAASWDHWIEQAEAYICNLIKYDAKTNWGSLNAVYKLLFTEYCERYAAIEGIKYDMSGYTDGIEAENMIKINWQRMLDIETLLKQADKQDFQGV